MATKNAATGSAGADGTIEALLERRAQYEQWLARLESTGDKAPASVRDRVRSDYEARLSGVIDELRGHAATIRQELEQHRATQHLLSAERRSAEETLAEAEVRYAVGEYAEVEWQRLSGESRQQLDRLRGDLDAVGREIARLAEVQSVISGTSARPVETAAPDEAPLFAAPAPEPVPSQPLAPVVAERAPIEERPPVEPMRVEPVEPIRPTEPLVTHGTEALDELAFLKSVSDEDERPTPAPRRPSGGAPAAPKAVEPAPAPAPVAPTPVAAAPTPTPVATSAATGASKPAGMAKTLKCNECGTLNRPTEWYCERCGAELAAL